MPLNQERTTIQTECSSRFKAIPLALESNSTTSLYITSLSPETFAIPSHK
jgi:hypothetical protein